jgi:hypothetical protein
VRYRRTVLTQDIRNFHQSGLELSSLWLSLDDRGALSGNSGKFTLSLMFQPWFASRHFEGSPGEVTVKEESFSLTPLGEDWQQRLGKQPRSCTLDGKP